MECVQQKAIYGLWQAYLGERQSSPKIIRAFYIEQVRESDFYYYGIVFEIFDLIANGPFEIDDAVTWNNAQRTIVAEAVAA